MSFGGVNGHVNFGAIRQTEIWLALATERDRDTDKQNLAWLFVCCFLACFFLFCPSAVRVVDEGAAREREREREREQEKERKRDR